MLRAILILLMLGGTASAQSGIGVSFNGSGFGGGGGGSPLGACTDGVDCYCDTVTDPNLIFCEDFDYPGLYSDVNFGDGAPDYGPLYDDTGQTNDRGYNSYWRRKYNNGSNGALFSSGEPASPTLGPSCGFALCTGLMAWHPDDLWDANSYTPLAAFYTSASDFTDEDATLTAPSNTASGVDGVFSGNANLVHRIPAGNTAAIIGDETWSLVTEIGLTMAVAYPVNSFDSGIWGTVGNEAAWKHNEWVTDVAPNCGWEGLFIFYNQVGPRSGIPFAGFMGAFGADCGGGHYTGSITDETAGNADLIGGANGVYWNTPTGYDQETDWPLGTWGCVRGHAVVSGGVVRHRVWFQGPNDTSESLIIDISATTDGLDNRNGWDGVKFNAYANTNQGGGYTASDELTFRYEDNIHVTNGTPVSCEAIGFP